MVLLIVLALVALAASAIFAPAPKPDPAPVVVERHHHHVTVIERPVRIEARILLIRAEIAARKTEAEHARLPAARALVRTTTALERYRRP